MMVRRGEMSRKVGVVMAAMVVVVLSGAIEAQLSPTARPLEPIPGFAEFNRLGTGRGDCRFSTSVTQPILSAVAGVQPVSNLGYAWGLFSAQSNSPDGLYNSIQTKSLLEISVSTGNDASMGEPQGSNGVFACGIVSSDLSLDCFGASTPTGITSPPTGAFFRVAAGYDHACALKFDASFIDVNSLLLNSETDRSSLYASVELSCWGTETTEGGTAFSNFDAGSSGNSASDPYVEVAAGAFFTCVRTLSGVLTCGGKTFFYDGADEVNADISGTVPAGFYGIVAAGPNNWCAVSESNVLSCDGEGLVNSSVTASGWSYSRGSLSVGNNFVCGIDDSTGLLQCARDTEIQDAATFAGLVSALQTQKIRAVGVNQWFICVTDFDFQISCNTDTAVIGNPTSNVAVDTVPCSPAPACVDRIIADTSSPNPLYTCTQTTCTGSGFVYQVGGSTTCTQSEVLSPFPVEPFTPSAGCTIIIDYTLREVV